MSDSQCPPGWDEGRAQRLIAQLERLSEEELAAEDEAAVTETGGQTVVTVPTPLLPHIRRLLARRSPG